MHDNAYEQQALEDLLRDITFMGGIPESAQVRGAFWRGWADPTALFVNHADGTQWIYQRNGERRRWMIDKARDRA